MSGKSLMHGGEESYSGVVPTKQLNKSERSPAEVVEGRPLTKENTQEPNPYRTPSRESGPSGLARVREAAQKDNKQKFTALLHQVSIDLLRDSDYSLKKQAAPGVDGMTWEEYGGDLEARLADLHGRVHRGAYRANLYLHYVLDIWVQAWRKKVAHGEVMIVRYADDGAPRAQRAEEGPMCVTV